MNLRQQEGERHEMNLRQQEEEWDAVSFKSILHIEPQRIPQYEYMKKDQNQILIWGCGALA